MASLGGLTVDLSANIVRFERALTRAERIMQRRTRNMRQVAIRAGTAIGAALGSIRFAQLTSQIIDSGDQMAKFSRRIGISVEALSNLAFAAQRSGVPLQSLQIALQRQTRRISNATRETNEATKALDQLGLSAERLNAMKPDKQFLAIAEALSKLESQQDRVAFAMKFWDSEGVALLQIAEGGADAVRELTERNRELGNELSTKTGKRFEEINDNITDFQASISGSARRLTVLFAPALQQATNNLAAFAKGFTDFFERRQKKIPITEDVEFLERRLGELREEAWKTRGAMENMGRFRANLTRALDLEPTLQKIGQVQKRLDELRKSQPAIETTVRSDEGFVGPPQPPAAVLKERARAAAAAEKERMRMIEASRREAEARMAQRAARLVRLNDQLFPKRARVQQYVADLRLLTEEYGEQSEQVKALAESFASVADDERLAKLADINERLFPERARVQEFVSELELVSAEYGEQSEEVKRLADEFVRLSNKQQETKKESDSLSDTWRDLGGTFSSAFEDAIVEGGKVSDMLKGLEQDIIRILTRRLVTEPLADAISGFGKSLAPAAGGGIGGLFQKFFGPGLASGGSIFAGQTRLVGERGPELFTPGQAGYVTPNNSVSNKVNLTFNVSGGEGSRRSVDRLATMVGRTVDRALKRNT